MRAKEATLLVLCVSSLAAGLACRERPRAAAPASSARPADAGTMVTVYVPSHLAERVMGRLQAVAARHQWALSVRSDSAALREADLVIADSGGALRGRLRPGSPAAAQAKVMADAVLP